MFVHLHWYSFIFFHIYFLILFQRERKHFEEGFELASFQAQRNIGSSKTYVLHSKQERLEFPHLFHPPPPEALSSSSSAFLFFSMDGCTPMGRYCPWNSGSVKMVSPSSTSNAHEFSKMIFEKANPIKNIKQPNHLWMSTFKMKKKRVFLLPALGVILLFLSKERAKQHPAAQPPCAVLKSHHPWDSYPWISSCSNPSLPPTTEPRKIWRPV